MPDGAVVAFLPGPPGSFLPSVPVRDLDQAEAEEGYPAEGDDPGEPATPAAFLFREHYDG